jgi:hypothetical protein
VHFPAKAYMMRLSNCMTQFTKNSRKSMNTEKPNAPYTPENTSPFKLELMILLLIPVIVGSAILQMAQLNIL